MNYLKSPTLNFERCPIFILQLNYKLVMLLGERNVNSARSTSTCSNEDWRD